jgi:two-component system OmpR family sensor kinase
MLRRWRRWLQAPSTIQSRLERTSLIAVLLGYGLLLAVDLQLFNEQRYQRQLQTMERAELLLAESAQAMARSSGGSRKGRFDSSGLQRTLSDFSSYRLALWMHPQGIPASLVAPKRSSNALISTMPGLRERAETLAHRNTLPQLFEDQDRHYVISSRVVEFGGASWDLYLLEDVSEEVRFQRLLNGLLLLAAALASLVTILINRRGIERSLQPLKHFNRRIAAVSSSSMEKQPFRPEQEPEELQPLAQGFNDLLARLAEAFTRQRQFASTVSHELRNPITLISGYSGQLLRRSENLTPQQIEQLGIIEEEGRRLSRLISDLLAITRADNDRLAVEPVPVRVCDAAEQALRLAQGSRSHHLRLVPPDLADPHTLQALADRDRLVQCLVNLLENACKFSPPHTTVELSCSCSDERVLLRVQDQGPGVPEADRERIFERFKRGRHAAGVPGSGIGLSVVQTLVQQMEGSIQVEAAEGGGAAFVLSLRRWLGPQRESPKPNDPPGGP